jgi:Flp pilus assembly protein TadG
MLVMLLAFGAIAVDVGHLYSRRRELQNGADAAALSIAQACANGNCNQYGVYTSSATSMAASNFGLGAAATAPTAEVECRNGGSWSAGSCGADSDGVRVTTRTVANNSFARVLGVNTSDVAANATVLMGTPSGLTSNMPLTISMCEWNAMTGGGSSFAPPPPYPPYPGSFERVIKFHTPGGTVCSSGPSGADLPGGFGWLNPDSNAPASSPCVATSNTTGWYDDKPGGSIPNECKNPNPDALTALLGKPLYIPIYDGLNGLTGSNGEYRMRGYAAFVLTGFKFPGNSRTSIAGTGTKCTGPDSCIIGFFTEALAPSSGTIGGGPSMGVTILQMTD